MDRYISGKGVRGLLLFYLLILRGGGGGRPGGGGGDTTQISHQAASYGLSLLSTLCKKISKPL